MNETKQSKTAFNIIWQSLFLIVIFFSLSGSSYAAFDEKIQSGRVSLSNGDLFLNNEKLTLPAEVMKYINEGDFIDIGQPEPFLLVYEGDKIKYGYGNIFHFSDKIEFINSVILEVIETKKSSSASSDEMINVKTYFNISNGKETKKFALNPGEFMQIMGLSVGVHRAEEPKGLREGPQHWYVYEVRTDISPLDELNYAESNDLFYKSIVMFGVLLIIIVFVIIKSRKN